MVEAADESSQRHAFERAYDELRTGVGPSYRALRSGLNDYPLAIYLDYEVLRERLHDVTASEARDFLARASGSPLHNRFLAAYLEHKGRDRQWGALLAVMAEPPHDQRLQCYYYRAQRATGNEALAWQGAAALWNVGKSQDEACDPLFERWIATEGPDEALVWSRALKAFDARSPHLIRYLKRFASPSLKALLDELMVVYRRPDRLVKDAHEPGILHAQLMTVGIRRLARVNPEKARQALMNAMDVQPFNDLELEAMEVLIARHSLFAQSSAPDTWVMDILERLRDDELTEIYLRNQIADGHWQHLLDGISWLSTEVGEEDQWRYWQARAVEEIQGPSAAIPLYQQLAEQRSYHGFLAADKLDLPYALNARTPPVLMPPADPGLARVEELLALGRESEAAAEWRLLVRRSEQTEQLALGQYAMGRDIPFMAIDAINTAGAWDVVDLRFPQAFFDAFSSAAKHTGVEVEQLMAIARRESAMYPGAVSRVGARGLMQVMPATARLVARKTDMPWRRGALNEVDYNIGIGSRYYRDLLDRFDGHRPLALAGYNAGPNRAQRWSQRNIPVDQWIDSLPFKETREYVRAVLAYTVIYKTRRADAASVPTNVLTADEWSLSNQEDNL